MEWADRAVILATRRHGETGLIVEALTYTHGRHLGMVRGGRSSRLRSAYQPGNTLDLTWRARLEDHLGVFSGEVTVPRAAALMETRMKLSGLTTAVALGRLLPEREPGPRLAHGLEDLLDRMTEGEESDWLAALIRYELAILNDLGFGIDLTVCAMTGATEGLAYVSPKTGSASTAAAGAPYADRLLALPRFLLEGTDDNPSPADLLDGFRLTGFFLDRHVFGPRSVSAPEARAALLADLEKREPG